MSLRSVIKFQKTLALAASASNSFEAEAAELAARRLIKSCNLDPMLIPNRAYVADIDFTDNPLLKKLRDEWRGVNPNFYYSKPDRDGSMRRLRRKPRPRKPKLVDIHMFDGLFDEAFSSLERV